MHGRPHLRSVYSRRSRLRKTFLHSRSLSDIDRSTAANDPRPSASCSARKYPQCIPANTPPVFPGLRPRIWPHLLRLVTKAMSDRLLELRWSAHLRADQPAGLSRATGGTNETGQTRGFEVRSSRFFGTSNPEHHTLLMPGTMLSPISPVTPFPLVAHSSRFARHAKPASTRGIKVRPLRK